ncbi:hypothetical protein DY000_02008014 [Brassica cretica]|uniref:Uncharacterized protein n=1 Tax=Brassica cretica TaxID=69181 RepID=A0ABQ7CFL5_BRACR|nr:hypothetical protein DY000_02008014 [Brassica cretica]
MAPDACTAKPRAPHVLQHGQDTCRTPPLLPDVRRHDWNSCKATHHLTHVEHHALVACAETPHAWSIHLVLLHIRMHVLLPCTATPRASVDTQLSGQRKPRSEHSHQATSCFSVHSSDFDSIITLTSLARHVTLPDRGVGLDGQSCSCLIVGWPVGLSSPTLGVGRPSVMFLFDCWPVVRPMLRTVRGCCRGDLGNGSSTKDWKALWKKPGQGFMNGSKCVNWMGAAKISYGNFNRLENIFTSEDDIYPYISWNRNYEVVENAAFHRADEVGDDRIMVLMRMIRTKHHFSDHIWEFEETPEFFWGLHDKQGEDDEVAENDESAQNDEEAPKNDEEVGSDEEF